MYIYLCICMYINNKYNHKSTNSKTLSYKNSFIATFHCSCILHD